MLVSGNESGGPHHIYVRLSYMDPGGQFKEARGFDFENSSNIQLRLLFLYYFV